ncbi:pPIWI_RE module domain-containing protein [Nonomuraea spiralis]|uniref:pPIWI_RE module domain-containing protein n=1 Tax=Nonomuraea spiralis TaxID=46182 RepID=UPI0037A1DE6E
MYHLINMTAYEPDPDAGPWHEDYRILTFPDEWRIPFMDLYRRRWRRDQPVSLPVSSLNDLLRSAAPGLVATGRGAGASAEVPWFYSIDEMPIELVTTLLASWVMTLPPDDEDTEQRSALNQALTLIEDYEPDWLSETVNLTAAGTSPGGTARPEQRLYHLLPERIGARLTTRPMTLNGSSLSFRLVSRDQGVELVSWPPQTYVRKRQIWRYSAVMTITVQTVPFAARFRVHVSYGIRRWATQAPVLLPDGRGVSVLLDAPLPWLDAANTRDRLALNSLAFDRSLGVLAWNRRSLAELLPGLDLIHSYPKPAELTAEPVTWMEGQGGIAAGIVYSTAMGTHGVGAGLMPLERSLLDHWIEDGLRPYFRRVAPLERVRGKSKPVLLPAKTKDPIKEELRSRRLVQARRDAVRAALGEQPLLIDVLWQNEQTRDELVEAIREWLKLPPIAAGADEHEWQVGNLGVIVRTRPLENLGAPLKADRRTGQSRAQALAHTIRARSAETAAYLGPGTSTAQLAIVETLGPDRFTARDSDPKSALRHGCAAAGRVSQFIVVPEDSEEPVERRALSAVADGMRQLGAVVPPQQRLGEELAPDLQYLALWYVRRQASGPTRQAGQYLVALRIRPDDEHHPVRGWDDARKEWVPYAQLLLTLIAGGGAEDIRSAADRRDAVQRRIRSLLYQVRDRPTLLLVNSGNLRDAWPGLSNGQLVRDKISFDRDREPSWIALYGPDLRVVLLRDANSREETSQWFAPGASEDLTPGLAQGLWCTRNADEDNRVFASTVDRPPAGRKVARDLLKLVPTESWPHAPAATASNPQALELTVLGCLSRAVLETSGRSDVRPDQPAIVAASAHQLRFHDEYHPLSRPLPLHLARQAEEYVLPLAREGSYEG